MHIRKAIHLSHREPDKGPDGTVLDIARGFPPTAPRQAGPGSRGSSGERHVESSLHLRSWPLGRSGVRREQSESKCYRTGDTIQRICRLAEGPCGGPSKGAGAVLSETTNSEAAYTPLPASETRLQSCLRLSAQPRTRSIALGTTDSGASGNSLSA